MTDNQFLDTLSNSFKVFLETGSRSNKKLKVLHAAIAKDIKERLGSMYYIHSLDESGGREAKIQGRYINKNVDITISEDKEAKKSIAGIGVKFVMQNYNQNSNNYFENMLGETVNIRAKNIPYFQIFIVPDKLPYYTKGGVIKKMEKFLAHHAKKYFSLASDDPDCYIHTPNKTLLYIISLPAINVELKTTKKAEYYNFYKNLYPLIIKKSTMNYGDFEKSVIFNDYEKFINKICHHIKSI